MRIVVALLNALAAVSGVAVVAVVAATLFLDPADYQARLVDAVGDATGRRLTIGGELRLTKSLWPVLEASDVSLANLPGGSRPAMAHAERIEARVSLLALLNRVVDITQLTLTGPNILFETVAGQPNWVFTPATPAEPATPAGEAGPGFALRVRAADVRNGMVTWRLPARTKVVGIRTLHFEREREGGPVLARSTLVYGDNQPFQLEIAATPTGAMMDPWQTRLRFAAFDTAATAGGSVAIAGPYDLQVEATSGAVEKLNALLPEMGLPPLRDAVLSARIANGARPGDLPVIGPANLRFASADLRATLPGLTLGATRATLPAAGGQAAIDSTGRYGGVPLHLTGTAGVPTRLDGAAALPVALSLAVGSDGTVGLTGTATLRTLQFAGLEGKATGKAAALASLRPMLGQGVPALEDVRFAGQVSVPAGGRPIRLRGMTLEAVEGDLSGEGSVDPAAAAALSGTWHSEQLDLDAALRAFGITLSAGAGATSGPVIPDTALPWGALGGAALDLRMTAGAVRFQGETWRDVRAAVVLKGGRLQAGPVSVAMPGSRMEATLTADAAGARPVSISVLAPALPLALLARYAGLPGAVAGTARVEARWQGQGSTVRALTGSLTGPFSVASGGGQLTNRALLDLVGPALEALGITVPAAGETRLDCLGIAGSFAAGVGTFRTIALQSTFLTVEGTGEVDLRRETVSFRLQPMAQVAGSPVSVPVVVQGPFRAVGGKLDAGGLEQLGFLLDGLFGGDRSRVCEAAGLAGK